MKQDKIILKKCLQELERVEFIFPKLIRSEIITEAADHLTAALNPKLEDDLTFVEPGDVCDACGDMATVERYTHYSVHRFCACCVKAYDVATGNAKIFNEGCALVDKGSDPEYAIQ